MKSPVRQMRESAKISNLSHRKQLSTFKNVSKLDCLQTRTILPVMATPGDDAKVLSDLITSTLGLLAQFNASLAPTAGPSTATALIENLPNPLRVLGDSAKLVKAHTTKLSLLAINKPFTPSAITKVLKELSATCLPAMMSAVQIFEQEKSTWGSMMGKEAQVRVARVFREMELLLKEVRSIAAGTETHARRDSLSSTGVVWESCDDLIKLELLGITGLVEQKALQYRDTIKDAIAELQEWAAGDDLDSEGQGDQLLDSDDEGVDGDIDSIEDIFHAANSMPKDRPELKALVEEAGGKLKKVAILYNALVKRRLRTFKGSNESRHGNESPILRLDDLMQHLKRLPHQVDELAGCFYDLDEERAKELLEKCLIEAKSASTVVDTDWNGREDEFTAWSRKWVQAVG